MSGQLSRWLQVVATETFCREEFYKGVFTDVELFGGGH
jgi:hypothetical protein